MFIFVSLFLNFFLNVFWLRRIPAVDVVQLLLLRQPAPQRVLPLQLLPLRPRLEVRTLPDRRQLREGGDQRDLDSTSIPKVLKKGNCFKLQDQSYVFNQIMIKVMCKFKFKLC